MKIFLRRGAVTTGWRKVAIAFGLVLGTIVALAAAELLRNQVFSAPAFRNVAPEVQPAGTLAPGQVSEQVAQNAPAGRLPLRQPATPQAPAQPPPAASAAAETPAGAPAQQAPQPQIPTRTEILNFDGWVVTCNEFAEGARKRICQAVLQIVQQNTNQVVFSWTVGIDNNKQLVTVMQTPTGVAIPPGVELRIGRSPARKIPFASCDTGRCIATLIMDSTLVRDMSTTPTAEAVIQGLQGNNVQFNIQMKGFDRAYAVLTRT
jgi:invasion protein IalB